MEAMGQVTYAIESRRQISKAYKCGREPAGVEVEQTEALTLLLGKLSLVARGSSASP
jgi:hypothetical protein